MNIFKRELSAFRNGLIKWSVGLCAIAIFWAAIYPGILKDGVDFKNMMLDLPPELLTMLGLLINELTSVDGFYGFIFNYVNLIGAIMAMLLGMTVISKESAGKTMDFLLTKPLKRATILKNKFLAALCGMLIVDAVFYAVVSFCAFALNTDFKVGVFYLINFSMVFVQLMFLSLGFLIGAAAKRIKAPVPLSMGIVVAFFIIGMLSDLFEDINLRYISLLNYFNVSTILLSGSYETKMVVLSLVLSVVFAVTGFAVFIKKDIHSA